MLLPYTSLKHRSFPKNPFVLKFKGTDKGFVGKSTMKSSFIGYRNSVECSSYPSLTFSRQAEWCPCKGSPSKSLEGERVSPWCRNFVDASEGFSMRW